MFDRAEIIVRAGDGGDGVISFRREKYVAFGGPDGGDGGDGRDVVLLTDLGVTSLKTFQHRRVYRAADGGNGRGKKQHGKKGENLVLLVPLGTIVLRNPQIGDDFLIADLEKTGQQVVVAKGGRGGLGNTHFTSSTNQAPQIAQEGEKGGETSIILELRLIADVGIVGFPNAGKSTLLAAASAAKPKIAAYPFTTIEPVLGVVEVGRKNFVLAEIPGLVDDAHLGRGLGHDFLRHITRTKILIHLVDGSSASPVEEMVKVNRELSLYDSALAQKPQLVAVNKVDLPQVQARLSQIKDAFSSVATQVCFVSAITGAGVPELMAEAEKLLSQIATQVKFAKEIPKKIFHPKPRDKGTSVHKEGDTFVVVAPGLERLFSGMGEVTTELRWQLKKRLASQGVIRTLRKAGIKPGDKVRCGNIEWEW